ncbi:DUF3843 family protein [Sphingobacterium sp. SRCM116780]|uniref:DUF3843 family protein n=1 Tax=Sphingobacterium sp. SRCM116780 TaxID=2907623 RepID=UPI001F36A772|nr:DUF3843 family protein [Sphingobacterium sp. SRCM116780]UIR55935.1 DUF3843 family protein [Sphingobacterium sp. SRCM116780]
MKKNRIYIQDWLGQHPYQGRSDSDRYYLQVANEIHDALRTLWFEEEETNELIKPEIIKTLSIYLTCYLEDVISDTKLFHAFRKEHQSLYGKMLPFFEDQDLVDYFPEDINSQDVLVLSWLFFSERNPHLFLDKNGRLLELVTDLAYAVLEEHYEVAPENMLLKKEYTLAVDANYLEVRNFAEKVIATNYITGGYYYNSLMQHMDIADLGRYQHDPAYLNQMTFRVRDNHFIFFRLHLLALKSCEFVSSMLETTHPQYESVRIIGNRIDSFFEFEKLQEERLQLKHLTTGETFLVNQNSIQNFQEPSSSQLFYMEIIPWKDAWNLSGMMSAVEADQIDLTANQEMDQAYLVESLRGKRTHIEQAEKQIEDLKNLFVKDHNGLLAFVEESNMQSLIHDLTQKYRKKVGLPQIDDQQNSTSDVPKNTIVTAFFNPKLGLEFFGGIENLFPIQHNPFFVQDEDVLIPYAQNLLQLLVQKFFSVGLVSHFYELYQAEINQQFFYHLDMKTLDFLLRFYKSDTYHNRPQLIIR